MGFDPITALAVGSAVVGGVGSLVGAGGAEEAGQAKSAADAYQAQVAANNAKIARQDARFDIQAGEAAAVNSGMKTRAEVGQQKAAQGASGIDVNSGSAVDVRAGTAEIGMLNASTIRSNAAKKAYADEVQATSDTAQSQLDTTQSQQDVIAGDTTAETDLLSGASSVGSSLAKFWKAG